MALHAAAIQVPQHLILEDKAGFAQLAGELLDRVLGHAGHADGRPNRHAINQTADNGTTLFMGELVHVLIILERSSIVKPFWD